VSDYIHTRYIAWSDLFFKAIEDLGFVEFEQKYIKNIVEIREFQKGNKFVKVSYSAIILWIKDDKQNSIIKYQGLSVNKDFFEYFVRKGEYPQK